MEKKAVHTTGREYTIRSWVSDISFSFCEHFSAKCNQMNPTKSRLELDHFSPLNIYLKSNANFYSIWERKREEKKKIAKEACKLISRVWSSLEMWNFTRICAAGFR